MSATAETGHAKNVANTKTLIEYLKGFGAKYNPSNENLLITNLEAMYAMADLKLKKVNKEKALFKEVEKQRMALFSPYKRLATKIINALSSSGAPASVVGHAVTINRKMQGTRPPGSKAKFDKHGKPIKRISVSQQSYDSKIEHLSKLIELLKIEPKYRPNEIELKVVTIEEYHAQLDAINEIYKEESAPYKNAIIDRNRYFYAPETGLLAIVQSVKNYVLSAFESTSPEYAQISDLVFRDA